MQILVTPDFTGRLAVGSAAVTDNDEISPLIMERLKQAAAEVVSSWPQLSEDTRNDLALLLGSSSAENKKTRKKPVSIDEHVAGLVAAAPPLSPAQLAKLAALFDV